MTCPCVKENAMKIKEQKEKKKILAEKEEIWTLSLYCEMGGLKTKLFGLCSVSLCCKMVRMTKGPTRWYLAFDLAT